jgi:mannose-6-phosphate isomerase-like protein (cupin superfamily)
MSIKEVEAKGISRCLAEEGLDPQRLRVHITEVEAGSRSHAAHTHAGVEGFYVLEGRATVEVENDRHTLGPNELILVDAARPHGISNAGPSRLRYMVIIAAITLSP